MHKLEQIRRDKGMGAMEFANWLGISYNTYKTILEGENTALGRKQIMQIWVENFIQINKKTGLYLEDILPNNPIIKLIKH